MHLYLFIYGYFGLASVVGSLPKQLSEEPPFWGMNPWLRETGNFADRRVGAEAIFLQKTGPESSTFLVGSRAWLSALSWQVGQTNSMNLSGLPSRDRSPPPRWPKIQKAQGH